MPISSLTGLKAKKHTLINKMHMKKYYIQGVISLIIGMLYIASGCSSSEEQYEKYYFRAKTLYENKKFDKARVAVKNAIQLNRQNAEAHYLLGLIEEQRDNWRSAFANFSRVVTIDATHIGALSHISALFFMDQNYQEANQVADDILNIDPQQTDALLIKASVLLNQAKFSEAERWVDQVLFVEPYQAAALNSKAKILLALNNEKNAELLLKKGIEENKTDVPMRVTLLQIYQQQGQHQRVIELFNKIIELDPSTLLFRSALAKYYLERKQPELAETVLRQALHDISGLESKQLLVEFLAKTQGNQVAAQTLLQFVAAETSGVSVRFSLAEFYQAIEQPGKASEVYQDIINSDTEDLAIEKARKKLAVLQVEQGRPGQAQKILNQVIEHNPRDNEALYLRGNLFLDRRIAQNAIDDLRIVLKDAPNNVKTVLALAKAHVLKGEMGLARQEFNRAIEISPSYLPARIELAALFLREKAFDKARDVYLVGLKTFPKAVELLTKLAEVEVKRNNWVTAKAIAKQIITLVPKHATGYYVLGAVLEMQEMYDEALQQFEFALQRQPQANKPLEGVIRVLLKENKLDEAVDRVTSMLDKDEKNANLYPILGRLYLQKQANAKAIEILQKGLDVNPVLAESYQLLASIDVAKGDADQAIERLTQGINVVSLMDGLFLQQLLAALYVNLGHIEKAQALYEGILNQTPYNDVVANELVVLLSNKNNAKDRESAVAIAQRFKPSNDYRYLDTLGWAYYRTGQVMKALHYLEKAYVLNQDRTELNQHLSVVRSQLKGVALEQN